VQIVQIIENKVYWIAPYPSLDAVPPFSDEIVLVEAPDDVRVGWLYDGKGGFTEPPKEPESPFEPEPTNMDIMGAIQTLTEKVDEGFGLS